MVTAILISGLMGIVVGMTIGAIYVWIFGLDDTRGDETNQVPKQKEKSQ